MKKLAFLCLPFIAMIISGCPDENAPQPTSKQSVIVPLALGNKWTYKHKYSYKDVNDSTIFGEETYTVSLDSVRDIEGTKVFTQIGSVIGGSTQVWGYPSYNNQGFGFYDQTTNVVKLAIKYPTEVGYKWGGDTVTTTNVKGNKLGQFFMYDYVVSTNTNVKANNRNYTCYQYRSQFCDVKTKEPIANSFIDNYYAENIGLVMIKHLHNGNEISQRELMDYMVK